MGALREHIFCSQLLEENPFLPLDFRGSCEAHPKDRESGSTENGWEGVDHGAVLPSFTARAAFAALRSAVGKRLHLFVALEPGS